MDKYTGKKLDGRYEIHELIGVGGMAMVYKAYDTIDDMTVAIKILKDEFSSNDEFLRRFKNESKAIAVLSHPNIVKVFDVSFGDMIQYIVMEYIDGITLKEYIDRSKEQNWKEALHFTTQILHALAHAHQKGIIHRDIKPQNIMLLQDGTIKVTDFGIARFSNNESRTMTDKAIGSVHYIAPEQVRGDLTDATADIYSVGVMLYEMLTGTLPFEADSAVSVAIMQLQSKPKRPKEINPEIPDGLEEITIKAMQKVPAKRYRGAQEMLKDIEMFKQNPSIKFEYTYLYQDEPTKYVATINETKNLNHTNAPVGNNDVANYMEDAEKVKSPYGSIIMGVVVALIIAIIAFSAMGIFKACENDQPESVDVPEFIGMNIDNVKNNAEYKFTWEIVNSYDPDKEEGMILAQEPTAGSKQVKEGSRIVLTVNSKNTYVSVPYVNGDFYETAIEKIEQKNLVAEIVYIYDENATVNVVKDTTPKAGTEVEIDSTIQIFVGTLENKEFNEVPDVSGMSMSEAKNAIEAAGFEFSYEYDSEIDKPKDSVVGQSPLPGVKLAPDSTITVLVAEGIVKEKTLSFAVPMPTEETESVYLRVIVNGAVDDKYSKQSFVPKYNSDYEISVTGTTTATVVIEIDGMTYCKYYIDFQRESGAVTLIEKNDYIPKNQQTTEPTQEPTSDVEPTTKDDEEQTDPQED